MARLLRRCYSHRRREAPRELLLLTFAYGLLREMRAQQFTNPQTPAGQNERRGPCREGLATVGIARTLPGRLQSPSEPQVLSDQHLRESTRRRRLKKSPWRRTYAAAGR